MAKNNVNLTGKSNLLTGNMELHGNIDLQAVEGLTPAKGNGVVKGSAAEGQGNDGDIKDAFEGLRKEFGDMFDKAFGPMFSNFKESIEKIIPETPFDETINNILGGKKGAKNDENVNDRDRNRLKAIDPKVAPGFILVYNKLDDIYEAIVDKQGGKDKDSKGGSLLGFVKGLAAFGGAVLTIAAATILFASALAILKLSGGTVWELVGMSVAMTVMVLAMAGAGRLAKDRSKDISAISFAIAMVGVCVLMMSWAVTIINKVGIVKSFLILGTFFGFISGLLIIIKGVAKATKSGLKDLGQVGLFMLGLGGCVLTLSFAIENVENAMSSPNFWPALGAIGVMLLGVGLIAMILMAVGPVITGSIPGFVGLGLFMLLLSTCVWLITEKVILPMQNALDAAGDFTTLLKLLGTIGLILLGLVGVALIASVAGMGMMAALPGLGVLLVVIGAIVLVAVALVTLLTHFTEIGEMIDKAYESMCGNAGTFLKLGIIFAAFAGLLATSLLTLLVINKLAVTAIIPLLGFIAFLGFFTLCLSLVLVSANSVSKITDELGDTQMDQKIENVFNVIGKFITNVVQGVDSINLWDTVKLIPKMLVINTIFGSIGSILEVISKAAKMASTSTEEGQKIMSMATNNIVDIVKRIFTEVIPSLGDAINSLKDTKAFKKGAKNIAEALDPIQKIFDIIPKLIETINNTDHAKTEEQVKLLKDNAKTYFTNLSNSLKAIFNGDAINKLKDVSVGWGLQGALEDIMSTLQYFDLNSETSITKALDTAISSFGKINTSNAKAKSDEIASFFGNGIQPMFNAINAIQGFGNADKVVKHSDKLLNIFDKYQGITIGETIPKAIENISAALTKLAAIGDIENQVDGIKTLFKTMSKLDTDKFKKNFKDFDIAEILKVNSFNQVTNAVNALANALERLGNASVLTSLDQISTKIDEAANKLSQVGGMLNNTKFVGANSQQSDMLRPQTAAAAGNNSSGALITSTDDKNSQDEMLKLMQKWDKDGFITKSKKEAEKEQAAKEGKGGLFGWGLGFL